MRRLHLLTLVGVVAFATGCTDAGEGGVKIGDDAPAWRNLPGTDGKTHSFEDLADAKAIVVAFTCNHCPVAVAYEDRFIEFAKAYKAKGVEFVAINVNNLEEDKLPAMKVRAEEKGFPFPYLYDASQKIGRDYGATATPHLFVLDQNRKVVYKGQFDDKQAADKATRKYVPDAVDAVLAGKEPPVAETPASGCSIKWDDK
jgi:peroxiredoxin